MTASDVDPAYSLEYSLEPADLRDFYSNYGKLRTRRGWMVCALVLFAAAAATLMIILVKGIISTPGPYKQPQILVPIALLTGLAISAGRISWRLAPSRQARLSWKKSPELHGRHRDDVGPQGLTNTSPNGTQTFVPWSVIATVGETDRTFVLRDANGRARVGLPKRGLSDPALLPALRTYIREAAGTHPPAASMAGIPSQHGHAPESARP